MAKQDTLAPVIFVFPQDIFIEFADPEMNEAAKNVIKLHNSVYKVNLLKETNHANHYGKVKKGFNFTMR